MGEEGGEGPVGVFLLVVALQIYQTLRCMSYGSALLFGSSTLYVGKDEEKKTKNGGKE